MAHVVIGFPNFVDDGSLSGGGWNVSLPLTNLQNRLLNKKARTTDATTTNTQLAFSMTTDKVVKVIGLIATNLSASSKYKITWSNDSGFSPEIGNTGWLDVFGEVYDSLALEWEDDRFWLGEISEAELEGYPRHLIHVFDVLTVARYWKIELDDTTNSDGYVEAGRLFFGSGWQPLFNASYGMTLGWVDPSEIDTSLSGVEYYDEKTKYRIVRFAIDTMPYYEGHQNAFELTRRQGTTSEVLFVSDPDDRENVHRRNFLGRLNQLNPLEYPYWNNTSMGFEIKEVI